MTRTDRGARKILFSVLRRLSTGSLTIIDSDGKYQFGPQDGGISRATVNVHSLGVYRQVLQHGSVGLGKTYIDNDWDTDDLAVFLQMCARELPRLEPLRHRIDRVTQPVLGPIRRVAYRNNKSKDRDNIHSHYDLGNDFFAQFLDPTMMYSSAYFPNEVLSLEEASREKLARLCTKLQLCSEDHVLEIGSGWGEFACFAAKNYGCRVTTTTISTEQERHVRERVQREGLSAQITVLGQHYRDLVGTFDAVVSIEMIEAVDWRDHQTFFHTCAQRLTPKGRLGLQAIVIGDQRYERAKTNEDFIKRYVFPGGCLPSVQAIMTATTKATDFSLTDLEDFGHHYGETLRRWRVQFNQHRDALTERGYDETLQRLWNFYLAYCEGGFVERYVSVVQAVFVRPQWRPNGLQARSV